MNLIVANKIKAIMDERDITISVLPCCYYFLIEKEYRKAIVKIMRGE